MSAKLNIDETVGRVVSEMISELEPNGVGDKAKAMLKKNVMSNLKRADKLLQGQFTEIARSYMNLEDWVNSDEEERRKKLPYNVYDTLESISRAISEVESAISLFEGVR